MKKEIQPVKNNNTMENISVPQYILSAINHYIVTIAVNTYNKNQDDYESALRQSLQENSYELFNILKSNMTSVKTVPIKKEKDPNAPKRGKSSYIYFCVEKREDIKNSNPDMDAKDIIKELGRVWRENVSDLDKARYIKMSESDKDRYDNEMKNYTPTTPTTQVYKNNKQKGPKRGVTAYIYFCKEYRNIIKKEKPHLSAKELTTELSSSWKNISDDDRKPYDNLASIDKTRYENEKNNIVYNQDESHPVNKSSSKKKDKVTD
jgi:hypothetical protein